MYIANPHHQWIDLAPDLSPLNERQLSTQLGMSTAIAAIPLSLYLLGVAVGQPTIIGFFGWVLMSCLIAALPFVIAIVRYYIRHYKSWAELGGNNEGLSYWIEHPTPTPVVPPTLTETLALSLQRCGKQKSLEWRGWNMRYSYLRNQESQVPIILVHGFGGSIGHWRQNIPELSKHHSVYALDLLGFGGSDKPETGYSLQLWVDQVYAFWKAHINVPAVLVGNSLGSATCLAIAATYPEMVRGVAMISLPDTSSHGESIPPALRRLLHWVHQITLSPMLLQPLFHLLKQPWIVRHWASLAYACRDAVTDELLEILLAPARERGSAAAFCAILKAMLEPHPVLNIRTSLSKLKIPSLLLWGKQDRMVPITLARRFLSYNPALQLVELDNAGHCAHDECPDQVNRMLIHWIHTQVISASQPA